MWQRMRELALRNAPNGKLPASFHDVPHVPPPPAPTVEDADIMDLSMELNAATIEDGPEDTDEHGVERVPMADPGIAVR